MQFGELQDCLRALEAVLVEVERVATQDPDLRVSIGAIRAEAQPLVESGEIAARLQVITAILPRDEETLRGLVQSLAKIEAAFPAGVALVSGTRQIALSAWASVIQKIEFRSRDDVTEIADRFGEISEKILLDAADGGNSEIVGLIVSLVARVGDYLASTARPLPRLVTYETSASLPSVVLAHRLYQDAGRAHEIEGENNVVQPAFMPRKGRTLVV